ncbi:MAG: hypothetical protein MJH09_09000 [Cetobacterium sp.]|uniref:Uncharacterized protein n=1 Tax=Cetobacterium ceti TaxID=180163 RepID=A0A1T4LJZ3_9FUSO|nr:hypothetical protein [Cetobacterium ceti]MCJ8342966.1 hypothetical protein [Cetobacterium sp.]SJZ54754.1 hypothetical protein SAMN02745174_00879 [Cetobacterium ceti]
MMINKKSNLFRVEMYLGKRIYDNQEFDDIKFREFFYKLDLAEKYFARLSSKLEEGQEMRIFRKTDINKWDLLDSMTYTEKVERCS